MKRAFLVVVSVAGMSDALLAQSPGAWSAVERQSAIAACRHSMVARAEQGYMKRHNLQALPRGFREMIGPVIEPYLAICDCSVGEVEKRWSPSEFVSRQDEVQRVMEATITSGACALNVPPRPGPVQ